MLQVSGRKKRKGRRFFDVPESHEGSMGVKTWGFVAFVVEAGRLPLDSGRKDVRELALGGVFGACAFMLPFLFHLVQLGRIFMPMYLPLVTLAFLVRPRVAAPTAIMCPVLSGAITGMPPLYPPVAPIMSMELGLMAWIISACATRWPKANPWLILVPTLALGRVVNVGLIYTSALLIELPGGFLAGASLLAGWPGVLLMIITVPPLVKLVGRASLGLKEQKA